MSIFKIPVKTFFGRLIFNKPPHPRLCKPSHPYIKAPRQARHVPAWSEEVALVTSKDFIEVRCLKVIDLEGSIS